MDELTKAAREARNAYRRRWAKANPDKIREQQARYWSRKANEAQQEQQTQEAEN